MGDFVLFHESIVAKCVILSMYEVEIGIPLRQHTASEAVTIIIFLLQSKWQQRMEWNQCSRHVYLIGIINCSLTIGRGAARVLCRPHANNGIEGCVICTRLKGEYGCADIACHTEIEEQQRVENGKLKLSVTRRQEP